MTEDQRIELTSQEQEALKSLSRERHPPDDLEGRVLDALEHHGLVRPATPRRERRQAQLAAAAVALLALGFLAGRFALPQPTPAPPVTTPSAVSKFILLLYDSPEREAARTPEENQQLAAEYGAWAQQIGRAGHFLDGDPFPLGGRMLRQISGQVETGPEPATAGEVVVGYFMIQAESYERALEIARDCPHLKYEGGVLVRPVGYARGADPTE